MVSFPAAQTQWTKTQPSKLIFLNTSGYYSAKALFGKVKLGWKRVKKIHKVPKKQGKRLQLPTLLQKNYLCWLSCPLLAHQAYQDPNPQGLWPQQGMIAQNIWTTLGHHAPVLPFFSLLISSVNICTADPAGESPVPCKSLQLPCASFSWCKFRQICGKQEILFAPKSFCRIFLKGLNAMEKHQEANSALGYTKRGVNQLKAVREAGFIPVEAEAELSPLHFAIFCTSSSGLWKMRCIFLIVAWVEPANPRWQKAEEETSGAPKLEAVATSGTVL